MESKDESLVLTPKEARQLLRCSRGVFYQGVRTGTIPAIRLSPRKIIIPRQRFMEWLKGGGGNDSNAGKECGPASNRGAR